MCVCLCVRACARPKVFLRVCVIAHYGIAILEQKLFCTRVGPSRAQRGMRRRAIAGPTLEAAEDDDEEEKKLLSFS